MTAPWRFHDVRPGRARESQVEKFFKAEGDRADSIVREGIQNSLDAVGDDKIVRVRLAIGEWTSAQYRERWPRYSNGLSDHLDAVADRLADPPGPGDPFRYLVFEDFETTGLTGDPAEWHIPKEKNPFFDFFRGEGVSHKERGDRGRHGVGKFVFMAASRVRTIIGLTRRADDGRELLMGTTVLWHHAVGRKHYVPDGWLGNEDPREGENTLPLEDRAVLDRFKMDFDIARQTEPGLTIVVPWLDVDVRPESLVRSVVEGYFLPIVRNLLVVDVVDDDGRVERIDHTTIRDVVRRHTTSFTRPMASRLELADGFCTSSAPIVLNPPPGDGAPHWGPECVPAAAVAAIRARLRAGNFVHVRCPVRVKLKKDRTGEMSRFDVVFRIEPGETDHEIYFVREGILVPDVRKVRCAGLRGLVVIDEGPLGKFLGDAENPAHTQWQSQLANQYSFNAATIRYVEEAIPQILGLTREDEAAPDPLTMIDLFYLPDDSADAPTVKRKKAKGDKESVPPGPIPLPPPRPFRVEKLADGFVVRAGDVGAPRPTALEVVVAYETSKGNPFLKYHEADFRFDRSDGIESEFDGLVAGEYAFNRIVADVTKDEFELTVRGFDPNRDLRVKVTPRGLPGRTTVVTEAEEDADATAV